MLGERATAEPPHRPRGSPIARWHGRREHFLITRCAMGSESKLEESSPPPGKRLAARFALHVWL